jgi:hypothetical protein
MQESIAASAQARTTNTYVQTSFLLIAANTGDPGKSLTRDPLECHGCAAPPRLYADALATHGAVGSVTDLIGRAVPDASGSVGAACRLLITVTFPHGRSCNGISRQKKGVAN